MPAREAPPACVDLLWARARSGREKERVPGGGRGVQPPRPAAPVPTSFLFPCLVPAERNSLCESRLVWGHREAAACCQLVNKDEPTAGVSSQRHLCHSLVQRLLGSRTAPRLAIAVSSEMEGWRQSWPRPASCLAEPRGWGSSWGKGLTAPHSLLCQGRLPLNPTALRSSWPRDMGCSLPRFDVARGLYGPWHRVCGTGMERRWEGGGGQAGLRLGHAWLLSTSSSPSPSSFPSHPCPPGCSAVNGARLMQLAC